ncbi:hypothetical protein [Selenomonas ruminantium]|uniref:hypothetical protein n=1 Tax=Selenomonas ruminantium TaxID=971 RepID=UPI0026F2462A|nr:hypothetical protein [Selenomonas ruminantium]
MMSNNITKKLDISLNGLFTAMRDWMDSKPEQSVKLAEDIDEQAEEITTALNKFIAGVHCVAINGVNLYGVEAIGLNTEEFADDERCDIGMYFKKKNGETVALMIIQDGTGKLTAEKLLNGGLATLKSIELD